MPLYAFKCPKCGAEAEARAPVEWRPPQLGYRCTCGTNMVRVFTPPNLRGETVART